MRKNDELRIYIDQDCGCCHQAYVVAEHVRKHLPEVPVRMIDLSQPGVERPSHVFAVPTYTFNERTLSLGNPDEDALLAQLATLMDSSPVDH